MTTPLDTAESPLFTPTMLGAIELTNRVVMAPLTRMRAGEAGVPGELVAEHYAQRAGFGMIVTEGTYPSFESQAYVGQPGIASDEQAEGWRRVVESVHARGGRIVLQLMHGGRTAHPDLNGGRRVIAPSPIAIQGEARTAEGAKPHTVPDEMTAQDLALVMDEFRAAARRAMAAGFDGVEVHAANGYLLHQFLASTSNQRTDGYGGSPENRARYVAEVTAAVAAAIGSDRVGIRISPEINIQDVVEGDREDVIATYRALTQGLRLLDLAYLSVVHADTTGDIVRDIHEHFTGAMLVNGGFLKPEPTSFDDADALAREEFVRAVVVGRAAIANPDLVERWRKGLKQNEPRPEFFYAFTAEGYTDYPFLTESE